MKHLLTLFILLFHLSLSSQTIESIPQKGQSFIYNIAFSSNINEGKTGTDQIWNFENMKDSAAGKKLSYMDAKSTPYASKFPDADMVTVFGSSMDLLGKNEIYEYSSFDSASSTRISYGGYYSMQMLKYEKPFRSFKYPFKYDDEMNDSFSIAPMAGMQTSGTYFIKADAKGKLKLPYGTYDVLRIKNVQMITIKMGEVSLNTISTTYSFYNSAFTNPLVTITYVQAIGIEGEMVHVKSVQYYKP